MPLARRVIPTILCRGRALVKGRRFDAWRSVGVAAAAVRVQAIRGVDEIVLLDVAATPEGRGPDLGLVEELAAVVFCPLVVGGGVRSIDDVRALLAAGADSVVVGTAGPDVIREISDRVGRQAVVASVDYRLEAGRRAVYVGCGRTRIGSDPLERALELEAAGAGEILLTSIDREGTGEGYDLETIGEVAAGLGIPLVANGGCRDYADMVSAIEAGADGVAAGALFQFEDATPLEAARFLSRRGIEARV